MSIRSDFLLTNWPIDEQRAPLVIGWRVTYHRRR